MSVPDDVIASVADELARMGGEELRGKVVLHTSGALDASVLQSVRACGAAAASMHPMQTFSGVGVPPLEGKVFAIEGDKIAVRTARGIARALGGTPVSIAAAMKPLYHAAGAFAAGHLLALEEAGVQMLMTAGMKRREATRALLSLSRQVMEHYEKLGPRKAWTAVARELNLPPDKLLPTRDVLARYGQHVVAFSPFHPERDHEQRPAPRRLGRAGRLRRRPLGACPAAAVGVT